jgi:hypothetical protein
MKRFRASPISFSLALFLLAFAFYLADCVVASLVGTHPELPWFERGVCAGSPFGAIATGCVLLCAFWFLFFGERRMNQPKPRWLQSSPPLRSGSIRSRS